MGAWLVGVLLGYALHNLRERRVNIPKVICSNHDGSFGLAHLTLLIPSLALAGH